MTTTWSKADTLDVAIDHLYVIIELYNFLKENDLFEKFAESYWIRFKDYERLAIRMAKTEKAKKRAYKLVGDFIHEHSDDFAKAQSGTQSGIIEQVPNLKKKHLPTIKRTVLRFFPTFRTQIYNVERLETLIKENYLLINELDKIIKNYDEKGEA